MQGNKYLNRLLIVFLTIFSLTSCINELKKKPKSTLGKVITPRVQNSLTKDKKNFSTGILNRIEVIKKAKKITSIKYPNADDVLVDDYIYTKYNVDGTSTSWDDTFIKVLTEKGRRDHKSLSFYFSLPYSTVKIIVLELIKSDGKVIPVNIERNSKVMVENSQMGTNIYNPNNKILKVNIPNLEIGDMLRYVSCRKTVKARVPNTWSDYYMLEYTSPINSMTIEILAPAARPLRSISIKDEIQDTVKTSISKEAHNIRYKWQVKDVPRMYTEPNMPSLYSVAQRLMVSTIPNWEFVSSWYWNLSRPHLNAVTPKMREKVKSLISKIGNKRKRIEAIFRYVSQEIRYMGITTEKEAPGYEPHDVKITFENKYGVCRDKAALLVAMLRLGGFQAYPVLIHSGPKKDFDVPNPYFNHAIVGVETVNGNYILMDPTNENTRDMLPAYLCDKTYLVAKPKGDKLRLSSIIPSSENLLKIKTKATLSINGMLIGETEINFDGINDSIYRGYFARHKPLERKKFFEKIVKKVLPGAKILDYQIEPKNIRDTTKPLKITLKYIAENTIIKGDGKLILPPLWFGNKIGVVNFVLGKTGLEKRRYPLVTEIACGVSENFIIKLNGSFGPAISIPNSKPINQNDLIFWKQNYFIKDNYIKGNSNFELLNVTYSPKQYIILKNALKKIEFNRKKMPILYDASFSSFSDNNPNGNILVIGDAFKCDIINNNTWKTKHTVKKKILSYAGKKNNSELKFFYNPAWEDVNLIYAKVTTASGTVKNVRKEEINIMDQSWVGAAPRYSPGKVMVISLPAVDVNSVIEYSVERTYKKHPFFSHTEYMQSFNPIVKKSFSLTVPGKFLLKKSILNSKNSPLLTLKNSKNTYTSVIKNSQALKMEKNIPSLWSFVPSIAVSTGSWKSYAKKLKKAFLKLASHQQVSSLRALKITKNKKTSIDKLKAIRNYVSESIRQVGPQLSDYPVSKLTNADKTLIDGYGNSADRAILFYALLKAVNIHSEFILSSSVPAIKDLNRYVKVPKFDFFNTVLLKVKIDGNEYYLNNNDQYTPLDYTKSDSHYILSLNTGNISKLKLKDKLHSRTDFSYTITLKEDGKALITRKRTFFGNDYSYWNKRYSEISKEELKRLQMEMAAKISQSAKLLKNIKTDFNHYPGSETFTVAVDNFAVPEKNYLYLKLPGKVNSIFGEFSDNRENPYFIDDFKYSTRTYLLNIPKVFAGKIPIAPKSCSYNLPQHAGTISIINDREVFKSSSKPFVFISQDTKIQPAVIQPDNFDAIRNISQKISNRRNKVILLEKKKLEVKK
jgi:transglutaminase-like putative cysteine protease